MPLIRPPAEFAADQTARQALPSPALQRRDVLTIGSLTALGLSIWPGGGQAAEVGSSVVDFGSSVRPPAKRCVLIWLDGGPSHLETLDPKPEASREVRGGASTPQRRTPSSPRIRTRL